MNGNEEDEKDIKIILLGESGVGKTNLMNVFFGKEFQDLTDSTVVSFCYQDELQVGKNTYKYYMWDTAGQEKYRAINQIFIRDAKVILVVYAIDNIDSFREIDFWINFIKESKGENDPYILALIANKCDLFDSQVVSDEEGQKAANKYGIEFLTTSALVKAKSFKNFVLQLIIKYIEKTRNCKIETRDSLKINKEKNKEQKAKKKCC